jgi:hypothetical protein
MNDLTTEYLTVRCSRALKNALGRVAKRSVAKNISDHIRFALEHYIAEQGESLTVSDEEEEGIDEELIGK